ncbi:MAG: hypothetical protein KIT84_27220 [Labilithrix sp.]|nr:hypothetical protein [Labilithrix sp.]MCW5814748.1 hypothetical protein [Labilithrix sp.]
MPLYRTGSTIVVHGACFTSRSQVEILGTSTHWVLPTTFVSPNKLTAFWDADGVRSQYRESGFRVVTFVTPPQAGAIDDDAGFNPTPTVTVKKMPVPEIGSPEPASVPAGSATFTLKVWGNLNLNQVGMIDTGAQVFFNGALLQDIVFGCPGGYDLWCSVSATVPAALVSTSGTAQVTVVNPGAPPSEPLAFEIQ